MIEQDRSSSAIELERVLDNLMPVLQAVQPEKLATTLTAMSQALDGRGEQLGETLVSLGRYLGELNPQLPALKENISKLADVSNVYGDAAPDLLQRAHRPDRRRRKTVVEQRANLLALYGSLTTTSQDLTSFLTVNKNNIIAARRHRPADAGAARQVRARVPVPAQGARGVRAGRSARRSARAPTSPGCTSRWRSPQNRGKYVPGLDEPEYDDKRGPRCYDLVPRPDPFPQYPPDGPVQDGSQLAAARASRERRDPAAGQRGQRDRAVVG